MTTRPRVGRRPVARAISVSAASIAAAGVALHLSRSGNPTIVVLATFAFAAWLFCLVALVAALRARSVGLTVLALALVAAGAALYGPVVGTPRVLDDDDPGPGLPLQVMVQNLELGRATPDDVVRAVHADGVDLLMTVEATPEAADGLRAAGLTDSLPYEATATAPGSRGVAVWSRYPLSPAERIPGFSLGVLRTDMAGPSGPVTVVAVHTVAAVFDGARAVEEADRLRSYLGGLPGPAPVVVGGDFNATWDHVRFRELRDLGYADSVSAGEDGWIPTWPADRRFPPLIGIDHILARGAVAVGQTSTVRVDRTDHLGVQATVRLPPQRAR